MSYRTNNMLFCTKKSLRYLGKLGCAVTLIWISSHVGIIGNKRANVLEKEGSISETFFQDQAGLTTEQTK
jgi:hypothetical protein